MATNDGIFNCDESFTALIPSDAAILFWQYVQTSGTDVDFSGSQFILDRGYWIFEGQS